jgi:coproporphyrinogen III oxidase-like Fe-S oxidoreductase
MGRRGINRVSFGTQSFIDEELKSVDACTDGPISTVPCQSFAAQEFEYQF